MWDPQEFERHWRAEFPGEEAPAMQLDSVLDMERELERCKLNLKRLQQVLAEEKFKVFYLQAALAGEKPSPGCGLREGGDRGSPRATARPPVPARPKRAPPPPPPPPPRGQEGVPGCGPEPRCPALPDAEAPAKADSPPSVCLGLPTWPEAAGAGGAVRCLTAAIHEQLVQPRLLFRLREDCAPPGHDGSALCAPGEEPDSGIRAGRGSEEGEPEASGADDGGDSSDHDFEMVDLNEKFVFGHLLLPPCRLETRDEAHKPARACSPHRWMHLIPGGRRQQHRSRDLEPLDTEAKDGRASPLAMEEPPRRGAQEHLPAWRRRRFLRVTGRDSPTHSSPERGSDCSHNSSDHEDGFSAGRESVCLI